MTTIELGSKFVRRGLWLFVFGLCYLVCARSTSKAVSAGEQLAFSLCFYGIIAEFIAGYLFYFVVNSILPNFYFTPIDEGKHLWLGVQGACIALCLAGAILATKGIGRAMDAVVVKMKNPAGEKQ